MTTDALLMAERVIKRTRQDGDGSIESCWTYVGLDHRGYGRITFRGRAMYAHRAMWEAHMGAIPEGLVLDHLCHNRACVNPWHLNPTTPAINSRRRRGSRLGPGGELTHCIHGHELTPENKFYAQGSVRCRECQHVRQHRWWRRHHPIPQDR